MEVSSMLSNESRQQSGGSGTPTAQFEQSHGHQYPTRRSASVNAPSEQRYTTPPTQAFCESDNHTVAQSPPQSPIPKNVSFELHFDGAPNVRGRLPMRVRIFPHDNTESIVTTVKNFYGLYEQGVSFEDVTGNTLIASYENFTNDMTVYVRVVPDFSHRPDFPAQYGYRSGSPQRVHSLEQGASAMLPPQPAQILNYGQPPSRPGSRVSRKQSASPKLSQGRAGSQKSRSRSGVKTHGSSFQAGLDELNSDAHNGYSSSDGGAGSVTSSRKARSEQLATAEISVDNIVEGGRRKRAKFESSELPLFVPPQVPAPNSISSVSPQRRFNGADIQSPFARPTQRTFTYSVPLQSPQGNAPNEYSHNTPQSGSPFTVPPVPNHGHRLRDRTSGASLSTRSSLGSIRHSGGNILPTPDPTIASCISDEDVALQLMRLGDASNFSHGRTSASTLDDALSGRADVASSATSNSDDDESDTTEQPSLPPHRPRLKTEPGTEILGPALKKQRRLVDEVLPSLDSTEPSGDDVDGDYEDGVSKSEQDDHRQKPKPLKIKKVRTSNSLIKSSKQTKQPQVVKKVKPSGLSTGVQPPMSPASLPPQSRKTSAASTINFQHQPGADEDDLSTKPRCQRCRKSKKGCDRQRPCQRCKDAGIGADGCVSEDEGNGRKGRYGRHMGISVKKPEEQDYHAMEVDGVPELAGGSFTGLAGVPANTEKSKKRKR